MNCECLKCFPEDEVEKKFGVEKFVFRWLVGERKINLTSISAGEKSIYFTNGAKRK